MNQVFKRPLAETDLDEIWDYIAEDSPERAANFLRKLYTKMQILVASPNIGRKRDELAPGLRSFPYGNYVIFYVPTENGIDVVRVLQGSRDVEQVFQSTEDKAETE
nr:MAG: type II toxin-antitoxin system RelE/ParE family toxin [Leptolyngbya sp. IPPAS B-1204]